MRTIGVGTFKTTPRMRKLVNEVLRTGRISYGPMSKQFEHDLARIHGSSYGVLSNSGTSSLHTALQALKEIHDWHDGDEVIVPALTFVATINVILNNNLTPVLVDVEPDYYGIDVTRILPAITARTRAIMPVHLFGQPCDMSTITMLARTHGLKVIEDSCECMFVQHRGQMTGSMGDIGCFSTYVAHLLTTGVGGMAITKNPQYAAKMRSLVNHGRDGIYISIDDDNGLNEAERREVISRRFRFESPGHSFRITELESALGVAQLETWQQMIRKRQRNAARLTAGLTAYSQRLQLPSIRPQTEHAFMMYPIVMRHEDKTEITNYLEEHGIETREMLPLTNQPVYQSWCNEDAYPVAKWINRSGYYVASHQDLTRADIDHMIKTIGDYVNATKQRSAA